MTRILCANTLSPSTHCARYSFWINSHRLQLSNDYFYKNVHNFCAYLENCVRDRYLQDLLWWSFQPVASTINTLAGALYKVFSASPDQARKEMRQACFDYLSLGGTCSSGPVALLSGLNPRPLSLVLHFFAVAIYGVGRLQIPFPSPKRLWIGARLISVSICFFSRCDIDW